MKSMYYYEYCYYEDPSDTASKWYKIYCNYGVVILYNSHEMDGALQKFIELRAIKKKINWKVYGKAI